MCICIDFVIALVLGNVLAIYIVNDAKKIGEGRCQTIKK